MSSLKDFVFLVLLMTVAMVLASAGVLATQYLGSVL